MTDIPADRSGPPRPGSSRPGSSSPGHGVSLGTAFRVWMRIGLLSFGGPAGQIALMHRILVEELRWIGETRFLHALNYCMLLPGPEAQQLTVYIGWLMHRAAGGLIAGILFVLPGVVAIMALSLVYAAFGSVPLVAALFFGLKAAVLAIVLQAVVRLGGKALRNGAALGIAAAAFAAIFLFDVPFPLIVLGAALIGLAGGHFGWSAFAGGGGHGSVGGRALDDAESLLGEEIPAHARPTLGWSLKVAAICLALWLGPILALALWLGHVLIDKKGWPPLGRRFGVNAITAYLGASVMSVALMASGAWGWIWQQLANAMPQALELASMLQALVFVALWWGVAWWLDRRKIYLKI